MKKNATTKNKSLEISTRFITTASLKYSLAICFLAVSSIAFGQNPPPLPTVNYHQPIITDLNNDNILDTIILSSSMQEKWQFNKISISIAGHKKQTIIAKDAWASIDSTFSKNNKNSITSNDLFLLKSKGQSVILLFGWLNGVGYRTEFSIINIKDNKATMVFDSFIREVDVEKPITLTDLNNDGQTDFIYRNSSEYYQPVDSLKADIGTYSPYLVYTVDTECNLNKPLTKKYNEDNFVFAGYEYSEKIKVLFPRNGDKPKVIK